MPIKEYITPFGLSSSCSRRVTCWCSVVPLVVVGSVLALSSSAVVVVIVVVLLVVVLLVRVFLETSLSMELNAFSLIKKISN